MNPHDSRAQVVLMNEDPTEKQGRYLDIGRRIVAEYVRLRPSSADVRTEGIVDPELGHFELMYVGWDRGKRVHGTVFHFDLIDGKFWVQYDGTDWCVVEQLESAGVPKEDIILAWHPPHVRRHTGYAVG